jgi:chorismate synthase
MSGSSFGVLFRATTFGESHGGGIGAVVEGAAPGVELTEAHVQAELDRRRGGQSDLTTPRAEPDRVHILSGVFEGRTTGTPIAMVLYNADARPAAYDDIRDLFRPGHADYTYFKKYGIRDYRGSGRASGRETAARVAAGAVAKRLLARRGVRIAAYTWRAASVQCRQVDLSVVEANPMRACDAAAAEEMAAKVRQARDSGDSVGGIVQCRVMGLPAGLGEPVFDKLDADLAKAMLSIGAVKGIEFGAGFAAADMTGRQHNDEMTAGGFVTNNAGGVLGGISTGAELVFSVAVKPTSSISIPQRTIDVHGRDATVSTTGRHDPCICPRIVPVVEAMAAIVLEDHFQRQATLRQ